jgi:small-conductance mechanosensitive channel
MEPRLVNPVGPTESVVTWLIANREQVVFGAVVAGVIIAGLLLLRWLGQRTAERDPEGLHWRGVIGRALAKTSAIFMVVAAADGFATYSGMPPQLARIVDVAFIVAFALQGAVWARELVLGMISRRVSGRDASTLANAMSLIRVLVSFTVFAIAVILILDNLGVNVTALVAGLGIGGIAIGLAAQGIFSDLFAALSILFDKPFKRGDTIRYDNTTGTVQRIGLKTTRLRSLTGEQRVMANTKLLEREIHNLTEARARRMTIHFAVEAPAAAESLDAILTAAETAVESQKGCKLVRCVITGVGSDAFAQGVTYLAHELVYDDPSVDNDKIARDKSGVLRALIDQLAEHKFTLARASDLPPPLQPF